MGRLMARAACLALAILTCAAQEPRAAEFRIAVPALPETFDPHRASAPVERAAAAALYTGLVRVDAAGQLAPGAAESWQVSGDGRVYTFTLRGDLRWSDGTALTAADFAFSLGRALDPATAAPFADALLVIANADNFRLGLLERDSDFGVAASGPRTLTITLSRRSISFLEVLAEPVAMPVPRHALDAQPPVGNGPYVLASGADGMMLEKNPRYFGADALRVARAVLAVTEDPAGADLAWGFAPQPPRAGETAWPADGGAESYFIAVNTSRAPFDRRDVRHALAMAVDRESLIRDLHLTEAEPAYHMVPPRAAGYLPYQAPYRRINAEGRAAIAEVLLADVAGQGLPSVPGLFAVPAGAPHEDAAARIAEAWRGLGFDIRIEPRPWAEHLKALERGAFDVAIAAVPRRTDDPLAFVFPMSRLAGPWNITRYNETDFDQQLALADAENDADTRRGFLRKAEGVLIEDQAVIPLFFYVPQAMVGPRVQGWRPNARGVHPLEALSLR